MLYFQTTKLLLIAITEERIELIFQEFFQLVLTEIPEKSRLKFLKLVLSFTVDELPWDRFKIPKKKKHLTLIK